MPRAKHDAKKQDAAPAPEAGGGLRPIWSGTLSFGLVSVPVNLFPAQHAAGPALRWLAEDGTPLARRYYCPQDGQEVDAEHLVRGYLLPSGDYVTVSDEELAALAPKKSRDIDLRLFVRPDAIDPLYFERAYVMAPGGESVKPYRLLAEVMEQKGHAGIATFVMREKEYLVAIFAKGGLLQVETLRFADELRSASDVGLPAPHAPDGARVRAFTRAIGKLAKNGIAPRELSDEAAERLHELATRKQHSGQDVVEGPPPGALSARAEVIDMFEMLKQSLREAQPASGKRNEPRLKRKSRRR